MTWVAAGVAGASLIGGAMSGSKADKERKRQQAIEENRLAEEQQRLQKQGQSIGIVNQMYDSPARQAELQNFMDALRGYYGDQLTDQGDRASRKRKFAVARGGQTGGSVDYDTQQNLGEEYNRAVLQNEQRVRQGGSELTEQNEAARHNLINLIRSGMGATSAIRRGNTNIKSGIGTTLAGLQSQNLGDLFEGTTSTYRDMNAAAERKRGFGYGAGRKDLYGR